MSRKPAAGTVVFDNVTKTYALGKHRAYLAAAMPFGDGLARGERLNALEKVSFRVEPGEAFALIGANGAGKSTALKCLAGVIRPTSGRIQPGGRVSALIELGIGFHGDLNGYENAKFAAAIAGLRGAAAREAVDKAVEFAGIQQFMETPVKRYSSGMFARLSFGIAAHLPADVLIVDEILAVGDMAFQRKCFEHLAQLRADGGVTLLFVSHNEWILKETCPRGALLSHGKLVVEGSVSDVLQTYHGITSQDGASARTAAGARVVFHDVDMKPANREVPLHSSIDVSFGVTVSEELDNAVVSLAMFDKSGQAHWAIYSDENGLPLPPGRHDVVVTTESLNALPGPCRIELSAFGRNSPIGDDLRRLDFTVVGDVPSLWEHGLVHVRSSWKPQPKRVARKAPAKKPLTKKNTPRKR